VNEHTSSTEEPDRPSRDNELGRVEAWRLEKLLEAGYAVETASALACEPRVDLHRAIDLVAAGCRPALAADILL
jgi:hypothetical protein